MTPEQRKQIVDEIAREAARLVLKAPYGPDKHTTQDLIYRAADNTKAVREAVGRVERMLEARTS